MNEDEISSLVSWEAWKVVYVKSKDSYMKVRTGIPQKSFWDVWRDRKNEIKSLGIYVKKVESEENDHPPQWLVNHWKETSDEEKNEAKQEWANKQNSS
jgi:hypothetical protein